MNRISLALAAALALCATVASGATLTISADAEAVAVPLPAGNAAATLIVELDDYDVTAVVEIADDSLTLSARGLALEPGEHRLRVLVTRPNGDIDTLIEILLEVARSAAATHTQSLNVLLGGSARIAEGPDEDFAGFERDAYRGALQWGAERDSARWALRGNVDALYDSATTNAPDGNVWQAPGYLLQAARRFDTGSISLGLGDDPIALGNLLFSSYIRRGLRLDLDAFDQRARVQAFTLNSEPVTSFDADLVPTGDTGSVRGGYAVFAPVSAHPEWLRVTSGFVSGDTTLGGVAISSADSVTRYGGDSWNLALDSWSLGSALWLHAEFAQSSFDSDGLDTGEGEATDDATHFAAQLSSGSTPRILGLDQWTLGVEQQRIGLHFYSLGNLMLPGDLALTHGYLRLGAQGLQFSFDDTRHRSDLDDDPLRPRRKGHSRVISANYTPLTIDPSTGIWRVFGVPTLSLEWQDAAWRQAPQDAVLAGFDLDSRTRSQAVGLDLTHERVSLSLRRSTAGFDDRSSALIVDEFEVYTPGPDTNEVTWSAYLNWTAGERLTLSPQLQSTELRESVSGARSRSTMWGLQAQAVLVPERWWLQANYSESRDRPPPFDPFAPVDTLTSGGGTASLIYRAFGAGDAGPDIDVQLTGQYGRTYEHGVWLVTLGFTVNWNKESL
jgi:hypothetical protein